MLGCLTCRTLSGRFEMSWWPDRARPWAWCALFTTDELRTLEDQEDLLYWHQAAVSQPYFVENFH